MTGRAGWVAALALSSLCGCATGAGRAPGFLVRGLTYEGRLLLLDAEENLAAAAVRAEQAQQEHARARDERSDAQARAALYGEVDKPSTREAKAQLAFAAVTEQWAAAAARLAAGDAGCLRIRYELAKVESAQKIKVEGAGEVDPEAWAREARQCEEHLEEQRDGLRALQEERARAKVSWDQTRTALARHFRGARPGPFVE